MAMTQPGEQLYIELWVSLASLLRSYTAAHGLNGNRQATVELGENNITVRHGDAWLELDRRGSDITWRREDGRSGALQLTEAGRLRDPRSQNRDLGHPSLNPVHQDEEEMDMAAEAWARELMHES
jgi:hypothetical protein